MKSALDLFTPHYANQLPPDAKQIFATLFDDVAWLAYDAREAALEELSKQQPPPKYPAADEFHAAIRGFLAHIECVNVRAGKQIARAIPALATLSNKDLGIVSRIGREAMIARKYGLDLTDIAVLLRQVHAVAVDALAWTFLYYKFGKIPPTTPLREVLAADELKLTGADPAIPIGDVLPRDALVEACRDTCHGAYDVLSELDIELELDIGRDLRAPKPTVEDVVARYFEILCDAISTPAFGSAPRRNWNWEDLDEGKLKLPSGAEIKRFLFPPPRNPELMRDVEKGEWGLLKGYDDLTRRTRGQFDWLHQTYGGWCHRPARTDKPGERK